jgi:Domain of unknown function (DUF4263)
MSSISPKPSEEEIINNMKPDHLYSHSFGNGRYFQIVHESEEGLTVKVAERTLLKVTYIKDSSDINGLEIIKLIKGTPKQTLKLSNYNLAQIKASLNLLSTLNLDEIEERKIRLADGEVVFDNTLLSKIKMLFSGTNGEDELIKWLDEGLVTSRDIVNTGYRKKQLEIYKSLLEEDEYWKEYCKEVGISNSSEEKAWQKFFELNTWIFGYGLDYRFNGILQREFNASDTNADGKDGVISDYLLGDKRFTTFVEIKKPSTPLFGSALNRSRAWKLSNELIDGISQIIEQKASGQIKIERGGLFNSEEEEITQKSYDSKVILIIGSWNELAEDSPKTKAIKERTFELLRRDSRNVEIITYDELFDRASFIIHDGKKEEEEFDDLPF